MATPSGLNTLRYQIGHPGEGAWPESRDESVMAIRVFPEQFAEAYRGLSDAHLDTPYREGGWTLRQLAHYVSDSHMNFPVRTKLALTQDWPTILPYDEKRWAITAEVSGDIQAPLLLLRGLHARASALLAGLEEAEWQRGYVHPENGPTTVAQAAALYSWHGRHHTAHVTGLRQRRGWQRGYSGTVAQSFVGGDSSCDVATSSSSLSRTAPAPQPAALAAALESFLASNPRACVVEEGAVLFDMALARWSVSADGGRCVPHHHRA